MALQVKGKFIRLEAGEALTQKKQDGINVAELIKLDETLLTGSKVKLDGVQAATQPQIEDLQDQIDGIGTTVSSAAQAVVQTETNARIAADNTIKVAAGLSNDPLNTTLAVYEPDESTNYLKAADFTGTATLKQADTLLDAEIKAINDLIDLGKTAPVDPADLEGAVVTLDSNGKIRSDVMPALSITSVTVVADIAERDALTGMEEGDVVVVTSVESAPSSGQFVSKTFIKDSTGTWIELKAGGNVSDAAYGVLWAGDDVTAPSKSAVYDELETLVKLDGSRVMTGDLDMGTKKIVNLVDPVNDQDAATKKFVLDRVAEKDAASEISFAPTATVPETTVQDAIEGLDSRIVTLEAVAHYKEKFILSAADLAAGYIQLDREAKPSSIVASVGRLMIHEGVGEDFTVSVVAGKTRMTFVGNLVNPSPEELGENDVIYVKYMA